MLIAMEELVGSLEARAGQIQTNARFPNLRNKEPVLMKTDKGFLCELPAITNVQWRKHGKNSHSMNRTIIKESSMASTNNKDGGVLPGLGAHAFQAPLLDRAWWSQLWLRAWPFV